MLKFLIHFLLCLTCGSALAQSFTLSGAITDSVGKAIPFASVWLPEAGKSAVANELGEYKLFLNSGDYHLIFRYAGYKQQDENITLTHDLRLDVQLAPEAISLMGASVKADNSALADAIIRKVIARRKALLQEYSFFSCDAYTKNIQKLVKAPKRFLGQDVNKTIGLDSTGENILYQSETRSEFYVNGSHKKEIMIASKVAGDKQGFSFNRALDLQVNFYNNLLHWEALSKQSFVSPVADNAFNYYDYHFEGWFTTAGNTVYKIKVIPKHRFGPAFSGYVYILKNQWRLYSVDLRLTKDARIDFVDTLRINQQFIRLKKNVWKPEDVTFTFSGKVLGFEFEGYLLGVYSNYRLRPEVPADFFNNEILKVDKNANKKNPAYWILNRPLPLTDAEELNYEYNDSLEVKRQNKHYLDSVQRIGNKFKPLKVLIAGYRLDNLYKKSYWYFYPFHQVVFYNTVEGWGVNLRARYFKQYSYRRYLSFQPDIRYGFASKTLNANAAVTYQYDTLNHASITVKGGSDFLDLNNRGTINLFYNTLSTLFEGKNYLKLYRSHFASVRTQREIADGLQITAGVEISRRFPVKNSSYNPIFDKLKESLTSNNPLSPIADIDVFPINNAFTFETKASYTYGQLYSMRPDGKVYETARFPTIQIDYRKGIKNVFASAVDYDFISMDIFQDKIRAGLLGYSSFYLSAGGFINSNSLFFPDIHHFTGNQTAIYNPLFPNFHFLDYYAFSTQNPYFEGHYEHNFSGMFLSKVPLVRKLKLEEIVGGAYLTESGRDYKEVYLGLQRLLLRVDYGISWTTGEKPHHAFRIFYSF